MVIVIFFNYMYLLLFYVLIPKPNMAMDKLEQLFDRKLTPLLAKFDQLNIKVDDAMKSLSFLSEKDDEMIIKMAQLEKSNKDLKKENDLLHNEFSRANNEYIKIRGAQNELEQYGRGDCLEVRGIRQTESENTNGIIFQISSNIDVNIDHEDISTSHRLPGSGPTTKFHPSIVVKFTRRDVRNKLFHYYSCY